MQLRSSTITASKRSAAGESTRPAKKSRKSISKKVEKKAATSKVAKKAAIVEKTKTSKGSKKLPKFDIGTNIPKDLVLLNQDSKEVNLSTLAKKSHILVVFVYPRASTPGCTRQAKGFRDEYNDFKKANVCVVGLSADSPKAQTRFKERQGLQYDLLCDPDRKLISALGCKKNPKGTIRSHYIFVDGVLKIRHIKISPEQSFTKALEEVREM